MLFMVIEDFSESDPVEIYRHLRDKGRGIPDGLTYIDSWISADLSRCFQLMETEDVGLLQEWVLHWRGFWKGEIVPVTPSKTVQAIVAPHL